MTTKYRAMCAELIDALDSGIPAGRIRMSPLADRARALLAQAVAEGVLPLKERPDFIAGYREGLADRRRIIECEEAERPAAQPVAVSERLLGDELCWWFEPDEDDGYGGMWTLLRIRGGTTRYTHWLPSSALPTPEATND